VVAARPRARLARASAVATSHRRRIAGDDNPQRANFDETGTPSASDDGDSFNEMEHRTPPTTARQMPDRL